MTFLLITIALMLVAAVLWVMVCFSYIPRQHQHMATLWERVDYFLEARHEIYRQLIAFCQKPELAALKEKLDGLHATMEEDQHLSWDDIVGRSAVQQRMRAIAQEIFEQAMAVPNLPDAPLLQEMAVDLTHADAKLAEEVGHYNKAVAKYNRLLRTPPNDRLASRFDFIEAPLCQM